MNIWIFNHYAVGPGSSGGTRHFDLARELTAAGCKVTIFASSFQHQAKQDTKIPGSRPKVKEETFDGVRFVWLKTPSYVKNDIRRIWNMLAYSVRAYRQASVFQERPDIVIGSLMHPLAALVGCRIARKKKCAFYFEERDLCPQTLIDFGKLSEKHPVVKALGALETYLYKKARKIILLFDKAHLYVESRGISADKVIYLPNGVDMNRFMDSEQADALPPDIEAALESLSHRFLAVYAGSHGVSDNLDALLETAELLKGFDENIHLLFIGNGPEKERLMSLAGRQRLTNVTFLPAISKEYMPALLRRASIGLISLKDAVLYKWGMSFNKLYDYMASSLPTVIVSEGKVQIAAIDESGGGIIVNGPEEMAHMVSRLRTDEALRKTMGLRAKEYVSQQHSWQNLGKKLLSAALEDIPQIGAIHVPLSNREVKAHEC